MPENGGVIHPADANNCVDRNFLVVKASSPASNLVGDLGILPSFGGREVCGINQLGYF